MSTHVVLIHGVGRFDSTKAKNKLLPVLERFGLKATDFEPFDWCSIVGDPFDNLPKVGASLLRLPFISSADDPPRGLRGLGCAVSGYSFIAAQACALSFLPLILVFSALGWAAPAIPALLLITVLVILGCASEVLTNRRFPLRVCLRRTIFILVWPLLHTIATPAYIRPWRILLAIGLPIAMEVTFGTLLFALFNGVFWAAFIVNLSGWALLAFVAGAMFLVAYLAVYPIVKVFSDVVRWLGDAQYRGKVRRALIDHIGALGLSQADTLVLATHSLGSVIAVDYLLSRTDRKTQPQKTILITCGSPLNSLLYSFIPELFCSPLRVCQRLQEIIPDFEWINIYRPFDPIGRKIGIGNCTCSIEESTHQWHKQLFFAHTNYWTDKRVIKSLESALQRRANPESLTSSLDEEDFRWPGYIDTYKPVVRIWQYGKQFSIVVFAAVLVVAASWLVKFAKTDQSNFKNLQANGVQTTTEATCLPKIVNDTVNKLRTDVECNFSFEVRSQSRRINGTRTTKNPSLPLKWYRPLGGPGAPFQVCNISVIYEKQKPDHFLVTSYQATPGLSDPEDMCGRLQIDKGPWGDEGVESSSLLVAIPVFWALTVVVWRYTGLRWSSSLFGSEVDETWRTVRFIFGKRN